MAPATLLHNALASRELHAVEPLAGVIFSVIICLASITVISGFLTQRVLATKTWKRLPLVVWLVYFIYVDSYLFVFVTAILQFGLGVNTSVHICDGAILLCLVCYVTTKLIYLFLVERAHIIRGTTKHRLKSKLYIFNSFCMLGIYIVIAILNFVFRITRLESGLCIIGMQKISMIPLISFDAVVNVYLTILFLIPLKNLYSFKNLPRTAANKNLRTLALRTFIGTLCTLTSSVVNLTVLMVLNGEPGWVCLMCCNLDILFSAAVVQWVTSKDHAGSFSQNDTNPSHRGTDINLSHPRDHPHDGSHPRQHSLQKGFVNDGTVDPVDFGSPTKGYVSSRSEDFGEIKDDLEDGQRRPSSQKRVLDDMGDIAMEGSMNSSRGSQGDDGGYKPNGGMGPSASTTITGKSILLHPLHPMSHGARQEEHGGDVPSGVVVTTTISRESRPGAAVLGETGEGSSEDSERRGRRRPNNGRRPDAAGVFGDGAYMTYATTEITGGRQQGH